MGLKTWLLDFFLYTNFRILGAGIVSVVLGFILIFISVVIYKHYDTFYIQMIVGAIISIAAGSLPIFFSRAIYKTIYDWRA